MVSARVCVCVCLSSIGLYVVSPHGDAFKDQGEKDKVINSQINQTHLAESHVNGWLFMSLSDRVTQVQVGSGLRTTFPCICCVPFLLLLSLCPSVMLYICQGHVTTARSRSRWAVSHF